MTRRSALVATEDALDAAVDLGAVKLVEHLGSGDEDDAFGLDAGLVREGTSQEGLAGARGADEDRIHSALEEGEVEEREVATAELAAHRIEVEVEAVDGVDLGEPRVPDASGDGALDSARLLGVGEGADDSENGEVFAAGALEDLGQVLRHPGEAQPAELVQGEL